ncbi:MAG TPA: J domain-containing protein [Lacipirellulaceae bacterium]|jgi:hypothetical protein|nr:J domain-containing protein [Lacipirellulaceae bacterium]
MLADAAISEYHWPDGVDGVITASYILLIFGIAAAGYACMVLDIRAYLRSLRRALVVITHYRVELPEWIRRDTPRCIQALGLTMPCTPEQVLDAYRERVKVLHPDRGGTRKEFLLLQRHFEEAMSLLAASD